jgi:hypothetical protein
MPCEFWIDLGSAMSCAEYEVDPDDLSAATVAAKIGIPPD